MDDEQVVKSNKRAFFGVAIASAIAGSLLICFGFEERVAVLLGALFFFVSGLYAGTLMMYCTSSKVHDRPRS